MSSQRTTLLSPEEYLELERRAERKSEYFHGEMFAMSGASRRHVVIVNNLGGELRQRLKKRPCEIYSNDMRLRVAPNGLYTYPDVMVACGEPQFADDQSDTLLNPVLIAEVLSDSTENYDRGRKFEQYRTLPSLSEYVMVAQDAPRIEQYTRQPNGHWLLAETRGLNASVQLASIDCALPLAEIYDKIDFSW
jgi:Uma2 family endonuclease